MGSRIFSKFQYGKEVITTHGTAVPATKILSGAEIKPIPPDRVPVFAEDTLGVRAAATRSYIPELLVEDTLSLPHAAFQHMPLIFSCGLRGNITPSEVTPSQADYLWTHTPLMTASNTLDSTTMEMGDDTQAFEVEYVMFRNIKISGEIDQAGGDSPVKVDAQYFGRQMTPTTFTGSLANTLLTQMSAKTARFYKDALWANKGVTELAAILRGFEFEIMTGVHPKFFGSADKFFTTHGEAVIGAMLTLTLEGGSDADLLYDDFHTDPPVARAYALTITGPQIGTGTPHSLKLYLWAAPALVTPLAGESSGNNFHTAVLHGLYGITGAQIMDALVTTNSATI